MNNTYSLMEKTDQDFKDGDYCIIFFSWPFHNIHFCNVIALA